MELGNSTATIERPCLVRQLDAGFLSILDDASQPEIVPVRAFASPDTVCVLRTSGAPDPQD
jgi:hypothetical protein